MTRKRNALYTVVIKEESLKGGKTAFLSQHVLHSAKLQDIPGQYKRGKHSNYTHLIKEEDKQSVRDYIIDIFVPKY